MGFRKDSFATVWGAEVVSDTLTKARISISRKNKQTGEYETDFSGYVSFVGTAAAKKAAALKEKDRIKLGDIDVTNRYDKEKNTTYTNFKVFSFEMQGENAAAAPAAASPEPQPQVDGGEVDDSRLPF